VQTAVDCGSNSELYPCGNVQPMKFMMQGICQTSLEFASVSDNTGTSTQLLYDSQRQRNVRHSAKITQS